MRIYTSQFSNVPVSLTQDLFNINVGSNMAVKIHEVIVGQISATTVGNLRISLKRLPSTVTNGSGGTSGTSQSINPSDVAATSNVRINDTSNATTTGTTQILRSDIYNIITGYMFLPPIEDRPIIKPGQAFIVSLDTAPGSAQTMSGTIVFEELF